MIASPLEDLLPHNTQEKGRRTSHGTADTQGFRGRVILGVRLEVRLEVELGAG